MSNVPTTLPRLSLQDARAMAAPFGRKEQVILLGIRGYYKATMGNPSGNDRNIYDDAIVLMSPGIYATFNANTDPSVVRKGVAVLKLGVHIYRKGKHGLSKPSGAYPALRPANDAEELPVFRDGEGDSMGVAINIHRGGYNTTSSLGCQTIYPTQWKAFINAVYQQMDQYGQKTIPYLLIEA